VPSFGQKLRSERERRGVTLDDISLSTKIGTRLLRALEDEHFDQLPGGIFNKGFVRAYARHLGMDEDQVISDYLAASGETPPGKNIEPAVAEALEARAEGQSNGVAQIPWGVLAVALVLVAFGFASWGFYSREKQREDREAVSSGGGQTPISTAPAPASSPPASSQGADATGLPPGNSSQESDNALQAAPPAVAPGSATAQPAAAAPGEFVVLIKARDDSWMSITADGKEIMQDTLVANSEKSVHAQKTIAIRAGNVGAVDFFFNGKKLPTQGGEGEVKTLTFNSEGPEPPKPPTPTPDQTTPQ
jgi:cytoskeleton protein RodZ